MEKVADWQIDHYRDAYSRERVHHPLDWTNGALYVGMVKWAAMAESDKYYTWLKEVGEKHEWLLHKRKYHADDHTVGQMYIELYRKYGDEKMIQPTKDHFEFLMMHPAQGVIKLENSLSSGSLELVRCLIYVSSDLGKII